MVEPLKNPLESRPTIQRVCRSIGAEMTPYQYSILTGIIYNDYVKSSGFKPPKVKQRFTPTTKVRKFVSLFPPEYIPRMIEIINE